MHFKNAKMKLKCHQLFAALEPHCAEPFSPAILTQPMTPTALLDRTSITVCAFPSVFNHTSVGVLGSFQAHS